MKFLLEEVACYSAPNQRTAHKATVATIEKNELGWKVQGDVTLSTVQTLLASASKLSDTSTSNPLVVDLSGVNEVDTVCISLMFEWLRAAKTKRHAITFTNLPSNLVSLATVYGVLDLLPVAATH